MDLDPVRRKVLELIEDNETDLKNASLAIGIVFVALAGCCWAEAQRAGKDQLRDLAATLAQRYGAGAPAAAAEDAPSPAPAEAAAETC